ncbi:MAG: FAD-binding oxidoreductase [Actinomycetota bacterium]|nr:FAD-binding oxidoreductase [Actinomycetota bacterium]
MRQNTAFDPTVLSSAVTGRVVVPSDPDYDEVRAGFNGMIDKRPLAILRVENEADVAAGIRVAREFDLPLAIRAGGHSAPGFGNVDNGLVIDVRELQHVVIDDEARTIACGSGLNWKQFDAVTSAHGLAVTGGRVSGTGIAGLTIGSGSGWLERAMGLTSDSLIGLRLVTADGDIVDSDDDPELLWAHRGGGGNFGVITELRFQLRPLGPTVLGGLRFYPVERGREVLTAYRDVMMTAPKELCGGLAFITAPPAPFVPEEYRGKEIAATIVLWAGDPAEAEAGIAPLAALGEPIVDLVHQISYAELQGIMDAGAPAGKRDYFKGGFMSELSDAAISDIVALAESVTEPLTQIICAPLGAHTEYAAVGEDHSAIGHRNEQWSFQVLSLWSDEKDDAQQKAWTKNAAEIMSSYSDMVSYPNFLAADEAGDTETAYSPTVYRRLRAVKDRYDPQNVFRINNNIAPSVAPAG